MTEKLSFIFSSAFVLTILLSGRAEAQVSFPDTIIVNVELPGGGFSRVDTLLEGDTFMFTGFAHPFQYLNGGQLTFPDSSLPENVTLNIQVPGFAAIGMAAVSFGDSIAAGVTFNITPQDSAAPVSPFIFDLPVELTLPIPATLPSAIGTDVSTFVLAFRDTSGNFDTTGVSTRVRDAVLGITAQVDHFSDIVMTSDAILQGLDTIIVEVELPGGGFTRVDTLLEGDTFMFTGFAHPFQYLNGGQLTFPDSSLPENVTLNIQVPGFAAIGMAAVSFGDSIAAGVTFNITPQDSAAPVSPFIFDLPVELTLPIPATLPSAIGTDVSAFVLAFRDTSGNFDTTGVRTTIRDAVLGITAQVDHFSDIIITSEGLLYGEETDTLAPQITRGPEVSDVTNSSAIISWDTNEPTSGTVEYGTDSTLAQSVSVEELKEEQAVALSGLAPGTTYLFRVGATDSSGNGPTYSDIDSFTTEQTFLVQASVEIITREIEVTVGDSVQLLAVYIDTTGEEVDTTFIWSVAPDSLGSFDAFGLFSATHIGEGYIFALLGQLVDSTLVTVESEGPGPGDGGEGQLTIVPGDTTVAVGSVIQFTAYYMDTTGALIDTPAVWSVSGDPIGTISSGGILTVVSPGLGFVKGKVDNWERTATVAAVDTAIDTSGVNIINISRVLPDGHILPPQTLSEGQVYAIGGLPFPLNILNDGRLYFPSGSLHEDITILIKLPEFAQVGPDTVTFWGDIITGVDFDVIVADSLVEPYYFDTPLSIAIPFKRGLLDQLGVDPANLGLFFALDSATFDTSGIYNVTVDSVSNRIFSQVAHFSTLVVREQEDLGTVSVERTGEVLPGRFTLEQNYPNPFNPSTSIRFALPEAANIRIVVYDLLGQQVTQLMDNRFEPGNYQVVWDGRDASGREMPTGIYIARFLTPNYGKSIKMVLLK